jgi:hypothetical protein
MRGTDKFLLAIVIGIVLLVGAVLALAISRPGQPTYRPDDTPEGVAHNYTLALQLGDYARAYGYLSPTLAGYPADTEQMERDLGGYPFDPGYYYASREDTALAIETARVHDNTATVTIRETTYYQGGLFSSGQSSSTFDLFLRREDGLWRITRSGRYWSYCWEQPGGCK